MYKIVNNDFLSCLSNILPNSVKEASTYNLRAGNNFEIPSSFYPPIVRLCKDLGIEFDFLPTISQFKCSLKTTPEKVERTSEGERKYKIILTRIRHICSSSKAELFHVNSIQSSICNCGISNETAENIYTFSNAAFILPNAIYYFTIVTPIFIF